MAIKGIAVTIYVTMAVVFFCVASFGFANHDDAEADIAHRVSMLEELSMSGNYEHRLTHLEAVSESLKDSTEQNNILLKLLLGVSGLLSVDAGVRIVKKKEN